MADVDAGELRQWAECWQRAGIRLQALREEALRAIDTTRALQNLAGAFESCRLHHRPSPSSGLVVQQAWFKVLAARQSARD